MNTVAPNAAAPARPLFYWRLWLGNTALVSAGLLFYLATHYGTYEFFGAACLMALLPLIPILVLVGGAGSTIFILTKVWIDKRSLPQPIGLALLNAPGLLLTLGLIFLGANRSPTHRLEYICLGNAPASASQVRLAGYSTFLREEWLAVFTVDPKDFQAMVTQAQMAPADVTKFRQRLNSSALKEHPLLQKWPESKDLPCYQRVFKEKEEHQRGTVYATFDPGSSTAIVFREFRD